MLQIDSGAENVTAKAESGASCRQLATVATPHLSATKNVFGVAVFGSRAWSRLVHEAIGAEAHAADAALGAVSAAGFGVLDAIDVQNAADLGAAVAVMDI